MSVSIKVCVRCRPFTREDKLGVVLRQAGDENGEIELINSQYSTTRFAFTWAWWSAFGYHRKIKSNQDIADSMEMIDQQKAYESVGLKIKEDLMTGNAVVLFAYGLSGSGKTFTVFGPDAVDIPEAWFKHSDPHPLWGVFPRLAYELFKEKKDGWKISMKYFQNVVDTVRDLMSPIAQEQAYKAGMRKDSDGFMDIDWCRSVVLNSWDELRAHFMEANSRKAIAPTQFNHQSTRGHCIMTLEVEMPHPEREGMKQRGRIYVCDLAGTEPAGDIEYATYQKVSFDDGSIEYKYLGKHPDESKSRELQDQGKKINLSLTEMAQFFMKMAEAVMKKTLKPGKSIPGCNSYFLCKFLKDTMLQARTYLFCAVRPEVTFHNYTFSTLGFAKNASVVKLQPKKATTAASAAERKLMAELEEMRALVEQLRKEKESMAGGGGSQDMEALQSMLAAKQQELQNVLSGSSEESSHDKLMEQQKADYAKRGISLSYFESSTQEPHFINMDVDEYRSKRFMYIIRQDTVTFGPGGDIQPLSFNMVASHCSVTREGEGFSLVGGKGDVYHNGKQLPEGEKVSLSCWDRVVMGGDLLYFVIPAKAAEGKEMSASDAVAEYREGMKGRSQDDPAMKELQEQMRKFEEEKKEWEKRKQELGEAQASSEKSHEDDMKEQIIASQVNDQELRDVLPKISELTTIVQLLNRGFLSFETSLQRSSGKSGIPRVKVNVLNSRSNEVTFLDVFEFTKAYSIIKDEFSFLKAAIAGGREYKMKEENDPLRLLFDNSFQVGSAMVFLEMLGHNLDTLDDDKYVDIKKCTPPFNNIGKLEVRWVPLKDLESDPSDPPDMVENPEDLIGKSWTYLLEIVGATALPLTTDLAYCQYEFFGETYTTESVEQNTRSPAFNYKHKHHVPVVTQEFVNYLKKTHLEICVYVNPYIADPPKDTIDTNNPVVVKNLQEGRVVAASAADQAAPKEEAAKLQQQVQDLKIENEQLNAKLRAALEEIERLKAGGAPTPAISEPKDAEARSAAVVDTEMVSHSTPRQKLQEARMQDASINSSDGAAPS